MQSMRGVYTALRCVALHREPAREAIKKPRRPGGFARFFSTSLATGSMTRSQLTS
jgi:hypothetical protein